MDLELCNRVVVITGGAGAIGRSTARRFVDEGAIVVAGDLPHALSGAGRIPALDGVQLSALDLRSETQIRRFVQQIVERHGGIDVIVNNAAVFYFDELVDWPSLEPLNAHFEVGIRGPVTLIQEAWRLSPRSRQGAIVNISSVAGHVGEPKAFAYTAIKAAQKGLTLSCAMEMASAGGWCVTVSPGHTWTPVHAARASRQGLSRAEYERASSCIQSTLLRRFLTPEEIADWIVLAASKIGRPMSGQDLHVTGGIEPGGFNWAYETGS